MPDRNETDLQSHEKIMDNPDLPRRRRFDPNGLYQFALKTWYGLSTRPAAMPLIAVIIIAASVVLFGFSLWSIGIPIVLIAAALAYGVARPASSLFYPTVSHGPRDGRQVALTFDDGPDPGTTPRVLDALARHGARATFFVIGQRLAAQPELARLIPAEGHELGNHSWQHSRLQNLRGSRVQQGEIEHGAQAIVATGQSDMPLYRSPMGLKSPTLARAARRLGVKRIIAWSLHGKDTRTANPERIASHVLKKIRPGDIVLLHDGHDLPGKHRPACAEAVELILQGLAKRNLESVTVSALLCIPRSTNPQSTLQARTGTQTLRNQIR